MYTGNIQLRLFLVFVFISASAGIFAQHADSVYSGNFIPVQYEFDYSEIKGSAYYDETLRLGSIRYRSGEVKDTYMRYNVFEDAVEYLDEDRLQTINDPQNTESIQIGNKELVFSAFQAQNSFQRGYLWKASTGKVALYARYVIDFSEEEVGATGYHRKKPDEFRLKPTLWLIQKGNQIREISTSKNDLSEAFGGDFDEVENFRKKEKLKMRKDLDVIRMFDYFNSL